MSASPSPACAASGISQHRNSRRAAREAVEMALKQFPPSAPRVILLHATAGYDQKALADEAQQAAGSVPVVGCCAEGVIAGSWSDESPFAVCALAIADPSRRFRVGFTGGLNLDSEACGLHAIQDCFTACGSEVPRAILLFVDGITLNATRFQRGLDRGLEGKFIPLLGGASGDDWRFSSTHQYALGHAEQDGVAWCAILGGENPIWAFSHGCTPLSAQCRITRSQDNRIYEIDGQGVVDFLDRHVARACEPWLQDSINIALAFQAPSALRSASAEYLWRITHVVCPEAQRKLGYITIQTELPVGTMVQLARRDPERIRAGLPSLTASIVEGLQGRRPAFLLHYDCAGRGKVVFSQAARSEYFREIQKGLPPEIPWAGFFTFGEIAPVGPYNALHNYTAVLAAFP